jgi:hypothetical protein
MNTHLGAVSVAALGLLLTACGSGGNRTGPSATPGQGISGPWEFVAQSNSSGAITLVEADITANGTQSTASGPSQIQTATDSAGTWYVNGACVSESPGQNSLTGTVTGTSIALGFNEGGNLYTGDGTLSDNAISGTYSGNSGNCSDTGTFTATLVPSLSGNFAGTLNFPEGTDSVVASLTESSNYSLSVQTTLSGADTGAFTFSGSAVANVLFVSGTVNGNAFSLFGYFDSSGRFNGTPNSIAVYSDVPVGNYYPFYGLLVQQ